MPKDRGAEQGDVDGPLECSLRLELVATATRGRVAAQPWIGVGDPSKTQRLQAEHAIRIQRSSNFQLCGSEKVTGADDPRHAVQKDGGPADLEYMDDSDIMCYLVLVPSYLHEVDDANTKVGAE